MKKPISLKIEHDLLNQLNDLRKVTRIPRNALIEQGIGLMLQLYKQPLNEQEILKTTRKLINERRELYERLAKK